MPDVSVEPTAETPPVSTGYFDDGQMRARTTRTQGTIARLGYLTPQAEFGDVERGNPLPYTLPPAVRRDVGLDRETWRLEIVADPASNSKLERPMSKALGTALDFDGLLQLAESYGVRYLKGVTCNNIGEPLGMGLWEGVPLRVAIWMTRPVENIRRVYYYGYHNDDPAQLFQSSLSIGRVLEDPPGELPVLLCYKLNGELLSGKRGGPVRMVVPEAYGFKSVKWLQRVVLTNDWKANDTYALGNNDLESPMKTFARFVRVPSSVKAGEPITVTGLAQVGVSGLIKVQTWLHPLEAVLEGRPNSRMQQPSAPLGNLLNGALSRPSTAAHADSSAELLAAEGPNFEYANWQDASILPPPEHWDGGLPDDWSPAGVLQFDGAGAPNSWPLRYTIVHWSAVLDGVPAGRYALRCRSIDMNNIAQPLPRPFPKSGRADIERVDIQVEE